ncbi:DUF6303 family protein [Streptomyces sp. NPDC048606]|uniref:DUF6303 family protein n=1 Tax=Streptomyces sp. NPDC048606 TaxID=3154726 RepID=UPI00342CF1CA
MTHSARLTNAVFGEWELYIAVDGPVQSWPTYEFSRIQPPPTVAERMAALSALGYEPTDEAAWEWGEMDNGDEGDVTLVAFFDVRLIGGAS